MLLFYLASVHYRYAFFIFHIYPQDLSLFFLFLLLIKRCCRFLVEIMELVRSEVAFVSQVLPPCGDIEK